jgi:Ca-activated chloride channel family protein
VSDFHFLRPEFLYSLFVVVPLWLLIKYFPKSQQDWQGIIAPHLYQRLFSGEQKAQSTHLLPNLLCTALVLAIVAAAGPTTEKLPQPVFSVNEGHVVVMDMSLSMRSTDIAPDRLTRAKFKAIDLVKHINEGEIGLVAYAGDAFTISPLTEDVNTLESLIPSLSPEIMPVQGSDPLLALQHANELLTQAGYPNGTIYWITDGIDYKDNQSLAKWLNQHNLTINVLAVGTSEGAPITQADGELLKDASGAIVIPKLQAAPLFALAKQSGGKAANISTDESDINTITTRSFIPKTTKDSSEQSLTGDQWRELGPWLVIASFPLVLLLFRRGMLAVFLLSMLSLATPPRNAYAEEEPTSSTAISTLKNWFKNKDQRGLDAYESENYIKAAEEFDDPLWKGSALYRDGNYEDAINEFSKLDSAEAWYNRGNALAKSGQLEAASSAYAEALSRQENFEEAQENKALVDELLNQQQQNDQEQEKQDQNEQKQQNNQDNQQENQQENQQSDNGQNSNENDSQNEEQNQTDKNESDKNENNEQGDSSDSQEQNQQDSRSNQEQGEQQQEPQQQPSQQQQSGEQEAPEFNDQPRNGETDSNSDDTSVPDQQAVQNVLPNDAEMTDEEREQQQKIEALLRRVPNDPAFLLQQKMRLESQKRSQRRLPPSQEKKW